MTVEQIYRDRQTFSTKVFEVASVDLHALGIQVISYTIKGINDEVDYLHSLGQTRTAQVKRDALIGEAEAKKESTIAEAKAAEQAMEAKFANDTEVNTAKAEAEMAYQLPASKVNARIKEEEMQ